MLAFFRWRFNDKTRTAASSRANGGQQDSFRVYRAAIGKPGALLTKHGCGNLSIKVIM